MSFKPKFRKLIDDFKKYTPAQLCQEKQRMRKERDALNQFMAAISRAQKELRQEGKL